MKKILCYLCVCLLFLACSGERAQTQNSIEKIDYAIWADVLEKYVNDQGLVDYEGLLADRDHFDQFITQVETIDLNQLNEQEQKAFWINAYNAVTMKVILDHYPVNSIRSINFGLVWNIGRKVANDKKSLGDIEHKILRPLGDPRIHFAINCASIGCPKLPAKPFYPRTLEEQLEKETVRFINDREKIRLDRSANILYHSAILDWFKEDFLAVAPDLLSYIKKYLNESDKEYVSINDVNLEVIKYNWELNKQ